MLSPNLASILCYLCSLMRCWSFFVGTLDRCSRFLKHVTFLLETRQSNFAELCPFRRQSEMQKILDSFEKKNRKRINNGFATKVESIQLFWNNLLASLEAIFPKHRCHSKTLLIKAKVLNILIYCYYYYLHARRSSMHLLSKLELKIPPSYPKTTF